MATTEAELKRHLVLHKPVLNHRTTHFQVSMWTDQTFAQTCTDLEVLLVIRITASYGS